MAESEQNLIASRPSTGKGKKSQSLKIKPKSECSADAVTLLPALYLPFIGAGLTTLIVCRRHELTVFRMHRPPLSLPQSGKEDTWMDSGERDKSQGDHSVDWSQLKR